MNTNQTVVYENRTSRWQEKKPALLLLLTHLVILCAAAGGCAALLDIRLAVGAFGTAAVLLGCIAILSGKNASALFLGTVTALLGGGLTAWSVCRLLSHREAIAVTDGRLMAVLVQMAFLAAGLYCIVSPMLRAERTSKHCTQPVAAQCIATVPDSDCIVWRYRVGDRMYDFEEKRCDSFLLPRMGDCCILHIDPKAPERAMHIDRKLTAAQIAVGGLFLAEVLLTVTGAA